MKPQFGIRSKTFPRGDCRAGTGSSRDWAAKGTKLLQSGHRKALIHRSSGVPSAAPGMSLTATVSFAPAKPSLDKVPVGRERGSSACSDRYSNRGRLLPSWRYSIVRITVVEPISCLCSNCGREPMPQPRLNQEARAGGLQTCRSPFLFTERGFNGGRVLLCLWLTALNHP